jgi:protocatechuate 3,4-dioxygenase beta subunit
MRAARGRHGRDLACRRARRLLRLRGRRGQPHVLRGAQRTDAAGLAQFDTIYPGWYQGRTPHIHVKVHAGGETVHTGQLYFRTATTREVYTRVPYRRHGAPDTVNAEDRIYAAGGSRSLLALRRRGRGYVGRLTMGVQA